MIGKLTTVFMAAAMFVFMAFFGTLMGALSGWVVGWFFADTILAFFSYIFGAAHGFEMWQIGASLGFIGSFIRGRASGGGEFAAAMLKNWIKLVPRQPVPPIKPTIVRG